MGYLQNTRQRLASAAHVVGKHALTAGKVALGAAAVAGAAYHAYQRHAYQRHASQPDRTPVTNHGRAPHYVYRDGQWIAA